MKLVVMLFPILLISHHHHYYHLLLKRYQLYKECQHTVQMLKGITESL